MFSLMSLNALESGLLIAKLLLGLHIFQGSQRNSPFGDVRNWDKPVFPLAPEGMLRAGGRGMCGHAMGNVLEQGHAQQQQLVLGDLVQTSWEGLVPVTCLQRPACLEKGRGMSWSFEWQLHGALSVARSFCVRRLHRASLAKGGLQLLRVSLRVTKSP